MMVDAQTGRETLGVANENQIRLLVPFCATQSRDSSHSALYAPWYALTLRRITGGPCE
jgi:hypothetical protein